MSGTVTKVVEGVDKLFDEIVVNGRTVKSSAPSTHTTQTSPAPVAEPVEGQYVGAVQLNNVIHGLKDVPLNQRVANLETDVSGIEKLIPSTASSSNKLTDKNYVDSADSAMQSDISDIGAEITALQNLVGAIQSRLTELNAMIPNQASAQNQLADKDFVNSSISTNTANFLGTYTTLADIEAIQNPTNNDYAFLETTDASGNTVFDRYKYSGADNQWLFEYELNNSSFTAEQWATINSGLTSNSISNAINALDVASVGGNNKYIKAISETDGKISATEGDISTSVTQNNSDPVTSGAVWTALQAITPPSVVDAVTVGDMRPVTSNAVALELANMQPKFIPDFTRPIYEWRDRWDGSILNDHSENGYFTAPEDCYLLWDITFEFQGNDSGVATLGAVDSNNNEIALINNVFRTQGSYAPVDTNCNYGVLGLYISKGTRLHAYFKNNSSSGWNTGIYWNNNQNSILNFGYSKPKVFYLKAQSTS